jgi:hypothetical protein
MTVAEYNAVMNRDLILYAYGYVEYLDVFGKSHVTNFCHYYSVPRSDEPQVEGFRLCTEAPADYNMAT